VTEDHVSSKWCRWILFFVAWIPVHGLSAEIGSGSVGDEKTLDREVRTALAGAVDFFQKRAAEDEEGWVTPPTRTRKVLGHEIVVHLYRDALAHLGRVATFGMVGHTIEAFLKIKSEFGPSVTLPGLCDYIYNQRTADLGT
jgi:hypothetical protein